MIKKLLVAFDGSPESNSAFNFALDLAQTYKAELQVVAVVQFPEPPMDVETEAFLENGTNHYKNLFRELHKKANAVAIPIKTVVAAGRPEVQILHHIEKDKADVLVIGHQTQSRLGKWLVGSVTDKVVDHAPCTVIVVKKEHKRA